MAGLRVLVVGASIAGPTAAYWFAKIPGVTVTVIERFPSLRTGGQNIDLRTAGVTVMRKMPGMEDRVNEKKLDIGALCLVDDNGHPLVTFRSTGNPDQQSLLSEYEIFRGDLSRILYDMTKDDPAITYVFNEQVTAIHQKEDDGPVMVEFLNGHPSDEFDLVVACDGATSRTRAIGFNCRVREHIKPLGVWNFYYTVAGDLLNGSNWGYAWNKLPGKFHALLHDPYTNSTRVGMMRICPPGSDDPEGIMEKFHQASKQGTEPLRRLIAEHFASEAYKTPEILKGLEVADDLYATESVQVKMPSLYRGRFALVGDAGYAPGPTGNGTSLAIAGAYILAGEISKHNGDLAAGLKAYQERMQPIITDMQQVPPGIPSLMAPQTAWGLWARNKAMSVIAFLARYGSMFGWVAGLWASSLGHDKYGIPDYPFQNKP